MELNLACFEMFPVLKTKRLTMRAIELQDAEQIFGMRQNPRNGEFVLRPPMENGEDAKTIVEKMEAGYQQKQLIAWAGTLHGNKGLIGACGFNRIEHGNLRAEIGGELFVDYWGRNIAREAVAAVIDFGFTEMNLHTIEAKVNPENRGAIYLLELFGFEKEAHFKEYGYYQGAFHDLMVYTKFKEG